MISGKYQLYYAAGLLVVVVDFVTKIHMTYQLLLMMFLLDLLSGILVGASKKDVSSSKMYRGLLKKAMVTLIVLAAAAVQQANRIELGGVILSEALAKFFIAAEFVSLLENAALLGVPMPKKLKEVMVVLRDQLGLTEEKPAESADEKQVPNP